MEDQDLQQTNRRRLAAAVGLLILLLSATIGVLLYRLRGKRSAAGPPADRAALKALLPDGLTEEEAAARLDPESEVDNVIMGKPAVSRKQIIRGTIFTIFNLNLVLLGTIQILFVRPLDGLITLGIIVVNVVANVLQYEIAQRRLKAIAEEARPQVTVMRGGKARSVDPREIVTGDVITAGRGDQIIADGPLIGDGELLVDETMLGNGGGSVNKRNGDQLLAGSICLNGRAAYRADLLGDDRQVIQYLQSLPEPEIEKTAIEKILERIMRILLLIMISLVAVIIMRVIRLDMLDQMETLVDPIIVILNLAPASLFFMVVLTYVSSTADLAKLGALVKQSRSVEALAQLDVICFVKRGFLTGLGVDLQSMAGEGDDAQLALSRISQILGDYAYSSSERGPAMQALVSNFQGSQRIVTEHAPFLSAYGWSALVFDDDDLQGLYVLAEPAVLGIDLTAPDGQRVEQEEEPQEKSSISSSLTAMVRHPFARFRHRGQAEAEADGHDVEPAAEAEEAAQEIAAPARTANELSETEQGPQERPKKGLFGRFTSRVRGTVGSLGTLVSGDEVQDPEEEPELELQQEEHILIFAYNETIQSLDVTPGESQLPPDLIPLCQVKFEERVKPEASDSINLFGERGVAVKIFTADTPQDTATRLREAGVSLPEDPQLTAIDGPALDGLQAPELADSALTHTVFGSLSPQRSADIVRALLDSGLSVGMAGHGVNDVAALRAADLAIVRKDSSPAVLGLGDIVLLEEGQTTLARVLEKGQRIVKGLVDILKLYMTQIFYLLFLIIAIPLLLTGFPYTSQQAGLISLITLTIPALALTLWASTGKLPRAKLSSILLNFVVPAALAIAVLGFLVYAIVVRQGSSVAYAQNVLTYALVAIGLLLVVTIKPPVTFHFTRLPEMGDIRPSVMVIISAIVFIIIVRIPFFSEIFGVIPLQDRLDYVLVLGAALIWVVVVNIFWRLFPVATKVSGELRENIPA